MNDSGPGDTPDRSAAEASALLVGMLDLVERPAAVVGPTGRVMGANAAFATWYRQTLLRSEPPALLTEFLEGESYAALIENFSLPNEGSREIELSLATGESERCRLETVDTGGGPRLMLLVFDGPSESGSGQESRARSSLRHDLAGPLTAILGTAELLLIRGQQLPREVRDSLGKILENCGRISEILARDRQGTARAAGRGETPPGDS